MQNGKGEQRNSIVEKLDKYYLSQLIKINIINDKSCSCYVFLIYDENVTHCMSGSCLLLILTFYVFFGGVTFSFKWSILYVNSATLDIVGFRSVILWFVFISSVLFFFIFLFLLFCLLIIFNFLNFILVHLLSF